MKICIEYDRKKLQLSIDERNLIPAHRQAQPAPLIDIAAAARDALEHPFQFPPLRRALTPDDHVAIVIDESLPQLGGLQSATLEHICQANVLPRNITLVCAPSSLDQPWLDEIPEEFEDVNVEIHNPEDSKRLAYLATTKDGRRVYLNRTVVDADQIIVLTRRYYDALQRYLGGMFDLYPALGDDETRRERLQWSAKSNHTLRQEAEEVTWLLGAPFFLQVLQGNDGMVTHVIGGVQESTREAENLLDECWQFDVEKSADVVVACLSGDAKKHDFSDLARALANAARVVKKGGRIVLLTQSEPVLGTAAEIIREFGDSRLAKQHFEKEAVDEREAGYLWCMAAERASIYLLSQWPMEFAEDLLTVPLVKATEVQRLLTGDRSVIVLPDAQSIKAAVRANADLAV